MVQLLSDLIHNYVLVVAVVAWVTAQTIKMVLVWIETKKVRWERLMGSGGMPSSHSATVCGVVVAMARTIGVSSPLFALACVLAAIVMHDAMGVRLEAGKHARIINVLLKKVELQELTEESDLKELLGHTTLQVVAGGILGVVIALVIPVF